MERKESFIGLILAAGKGKRMQSNIPKVAHFLFGKPLIIWAIESLIHAEIKKIVVVISPSQKLVEEMIEKYSFSPDVQIKFAYQSESLGTGHAAQCGLKVISDSFVQGVEKDCKLNVLVVYGDTPAVEALTFKEFLKIHAENDNNFTILAFQTENPFGYGRIVLDKNNEFVLIKEEKDCSEEEKKIKLCNSGILCGCFFDFEKIIPKLQNNNASQEYYLTDVPLLARKYKEKIGYMIGGDENEFLGINSQVQLADMEIKFQNKYKK